MEISVGDLADRYSICRLKQERAKVDSSAEMNALQSAMPVDVRLQEYLDFLYLINGSIWTLESDLRRGKEGELGLEEVGRRAIQIRNWNQMRVFMKNELNTLFGTGFTEIKKDHASAS